LDVGQAIGSGTEMTEQSSFGAVTKTSAVTAHASII
jgi:hypothetical protein